MTEARHLTSAAREGALDNLAPRFARGTGACMKVVAAEAATGKCSRRARSCGSRLRGRGIMGAFPTPRRARGWIVERAFACEYA
jgi:hypothetical protein